MIERILIGKWKKYFFFAKTLPIKPNKLFFKEKNSKKFLCL